MSFWLRVYASDRAIANVTAILVTARHTNRSETIVVILEI
jgi:hypothetical protein